MVSSGPRWCWWLSLVVFSCPGSSIPDLGRSVSHSLSATFEFWHKEWLLSLQTLQTFDQHDVWTKRQKDKRQKDQKTLRQKGEKDCWKDSLTHIFHIDTNIFAGIEQKFHWIFWRRPYILFLSLKPNCCIFFRPILSSNKVQKVPDFFSFFLPNMG